MGTAHGSLASTIAEADRRVTVLDDRIDAEDHAEWLWLRAHVLHGLAAQRVVLGTESLTLAWNKRTTRFVTQAAAVLYLRRFVKDHRAMLALRQLASAAATGPVVSRSDDEVIAAVAAGLLLGRAWLIELPKRAPKSRFVTKTNPEAFAPINPKYGTKIDFAYIAKLEGDQWLRGYVPFKGKTGVVAGRSGMTVASGFDVGQWFFEDLKDMPLSLPVLTKLKPFVKPHDFRHMSRAQVAAAVGRLGPVPELLKSEADECDSAVFAAKLQSASQTWDRQHHAGVPKYTALPSGWQTVWLSRVYQGQTGSFETLALEGSWQQAVTALRSEPKYKERTEQEAKLLESEFPPAVTPARKGLK